MKLLPFLGKKSDEAKEFYAHEFAAREEISTVEGVQKSEEGGASSKKDDADDAAVVSTPRHICCVPGCGSNDIEYCGFCKKSYCPNHNNDEYHKH